MVSGFSDLLAPQFVDRSAASLGMDKPAHARQHRFVNQVFTPQAVAGLRPVVRGVVVGYFDRLVGRDQFDLVDDFSSRNPIHDDLCNYRGSGL